ncbi:NADH dehydrogenase [ubiquinone] 1 subunit C1, mitochondrial-like [Dromiciops gliroides]|uniref:NADH dehydrogenase [ubiquinone] 1 subunit C1, mitochondrial-like n=1 Tax=Dromiciops gliroides TaxID=33562 RepID=UPI001CC58370|nr:NADH dehydrogenase [ubiquinone] 1 subunit C1, mitochondrial-like [Dromiciops gliroides]
MALSLMLLPQLSQLLSGTRLPCHTFVRSAFYVQDNPNDKPNWLKVILTLGTTAGLWAFLLQQHEEDVLEYERRKGLE